MNNEIGRYRMRVHSSMSILDDTNVPLSEWMDGPDIARLQGGYNERHVDWEYTFELMHVPIVTFILRLSEWLQQSFSHGIFRVTIDQILRDEEGQIIHSETICANLDPCALSYQW